MMINDNIRKNNHEDKESNASLPNVLSCFTLKSIASALKQVSFHLFMPRRTGGTNKFVIVREANFTTLKCFKLQYLLKRLKESYEVLHTFISKGL
jgi:hypothetical protein